MKKFVLIFDFDGTLANTLLAIRDILNKLSKEFGFREIEAKDLQKLRGMSAKEIIYESGTSWWKIPRLIRRSKAELSRQIESLAPASGIQPVLKRLKEDGHTLFIVSSNSRENIEKFLIRNNLSGLFGFIVSDSHLWSKDRVLKKLIKKEKLTLNNIVYIGDEIRDVEAAKKAGVGAVAVTWGFNTKEALKKRNPDYLADKPEDIIEIISRI